MTPPYNSHATAGHPRLMPNGAGTLLRSIRGGFWRQKLARQGARTYLARIQGRHNAHDHTGVAFAKYSAPKGLQRADRAAAVRAAGFARGH